MLFIRRRITTEVISGLDWTLSFTETQRSHREQRSATAAAKKKNSPLWRSLFKTTICGEAGGNFCPTFRCRSEASFSLSLLWVLVSVDEEKTIIIIKSYSELYEPLPKKSEPYMTKQTGFSFLDKTFIWNKCALVTSSGSYRKLQHKPSF